MTIEEGKTAENSSVCPVCGGATTEIVKAQEFSISDNSSDKLSVEVPTLICGECGFEYTDFRAEEVRHDAICDHLRLLKPREILAIRKTYNMSRKEFSEAFGLGEASIERWENRKTFQNRALDNLLRLLVDRNNGQRLTNTRQLMAIASNSSHDTSNSNVFRFEPKFRSLSVHEIEQERSRSESFSLSSPRRIAR